MKMALGSLSKQRLRQWVSVKGTKRDAEKRLAELLHQFDTGAYMKPGKTTLADYLEQWLKDYAKRHLSPRGFERYQGIIRRHFIPALGKLPLTQLKPEHLQKHYTETLDSGLNQNTVRYHHAVMHIALETAVKWGLVSRNPADAVSPPRVKRPTMQTWTESEVTCFLEAARGSPYYALFYTALFTGARRSELLALTWRDIDFIFGQIHINRSLHHLKDGSYVFTQPKSEHSRRTIALPPSAFMVLDEHRKAREAQSLLLGSQLKDTDLVFSTLEGKPYRPNTITNAWRTLAKKCGVNVIRFHDARHTHASLMLKQGIHPKIVQERLGHSSIEMTLDIYSHITPGLQATAAAKFDEGLGLKPNPEAEKEAAWGVG